jgi:hypothetical protein
VTRILATPQHNKGPAVALNNVHVLEIINLAALATSTRRCGTKAQPVAVKVMEHGAESALGLQEHKNEGALLSLCEK